MSQRCTLEATESNGHPSATMTVVLSACIGPLVTVSVCTVSKICQLFLKKKKKKKVDSWLMFFLRICSNAQHQMEDTFDSSACGTITNEPVHLSERAEKKGGFFFS